MDRNMFFSALRLCGSLEGKGSQVFPELTVPSSPTTIDEAIVAQAKCNIEIVRWLNAYKGIAPSEFSLFSGSHAPALVYSTASQARISGDPAYISGNFDNYVGLLAENISNAASGSAWFGAEDANLRGELADTADYVSIFLNNLPTLPDEISAIANLVELAVVFLKQPGQFVIDIAEIILFHVIRVIVDWFLGKITGVQPPVSGQVEVRYLFEILENMGYQATWRERQTLAIERIRQGIRDDESDTPAPPIADMLESLGLIERKIIRNGHEIYVQDGVIMPAQAEESQE